MADDVANRFEASIAVMHNASTREAKFAEFGSRYIVREGGLGVPQRAA
jgi:hypothetical protein